MLLYSTRWLYIPFRLKECRTTCAELHSFKLDTPNKIETNNIKARMHNLLHRMWIHKVGSAASWGFSPASPRDVGVGRVRGCEELCPDAAARHPKTSAVQGARR